MADLNPSGMPVNPEDRAGSEVRALIAKGEYLKAADLAMAWPGLRQLQALALARGGSTDAAQAILDELVREGPADPEVLGLLARLAKDRWERAGARPDSPLLATAIDRYERAHAVHPGHWPAINAATLCRVAGENLRADRWLALARADAQATLDARPQDVWAHATLGEACLHAGDGDGATRHYAAASAAGLGSRASARRNGLLLAAALGRDPAWLEAWLPPPRVAVFAGHLLDAPGREPERFPERLAPAVRQALAAWVDAHPPGHVVASAARGSDLLMLEVLAERNVPFTVVLPCSLDRFLPYSVGPAWADRCQAMLARAEAIHVLSEGDLPGDEGVLSFATRVMLGLALWKATDLGGRLEALAVWEAGSEARAGGTAEFLARAAAAGVVCATLDLAHLRSTGQALIRPLQEAPPLPGELTATAGRHLRSFLFGDLAGFSAFNGGQVAAFVQHGLGLVAEVREAHGAEITVASTWGDGLMVVFETLPAAEAFATELLQRWTATDWAARGLPPDMAWRLSLHAGPLAEAMDPVARRPSVFGKPLVRAARMEPITPRNAIYVSLEFAALLMLEGGRGRTLDYAGVVSLPKNAGKFPLFRLRRARTDLPPGAPWAP